MMITARTVIGPILAGGTVGLARHTRSIIVVYQKKKGGKEKNWLDTGYKTKPEQRSAMESTFGRKAYIERRRGGVAHELK